jgi:hypothetical protein
MKTRPVAEGLFHADTQTVGLTDRHNHANLLEHFQIFDTFISRLTSVLAFATIFYTITKNKRHKTQRRYYSA